MISPKMTREFLKPAWVDWSHQTKAAGVPIIEEDSDGMIEELIPLWIESGFNVCDPGCQRTSLVIIQDSAGRRVSLISSGSSFSRREGHPPEI